MKDDGIVDKKQYSTLKQALLDRGYRYQDIELYGNRYREYESPNGWVWLTRKNSYDYPFVSITARSISKDKALGNSFVQHYKVPVPPSLHTADFALAREFLKENSKVIVKPVSGSGSRGLTLNIETEAELKRALEKATHAGSPPLVQKQFDGEEVRMTIIDGEVRSAILRQTPRVIGDGKLSVGRLIDEENEKRKKLKFPLLAYPVLDDKIIDLENISLQKVLRDGEIYEFSRATMIRNGSSFYGVLETLHPSYRAEAEKLAQALNPRMLIVDFLIKDYSAQATAENYIFLEFNTTPGLQIYTSLRGGDSPDIISMLADAVDSAATR